MHRALNFEGFIDFLKVADLIPIHVHRPAGRMKVQPLIVCWKAQPLIACSMPGHTQLQHLVNS
jgi:hypothetical protein